MPTRRSTSSKVSTERPAEDRGRAPETNRASRSRPRRRHVALAALCLLALFLPGRTTTTGPTPEPTGWGDAPRPEGSTVALRVENGASEPPGEVRVTLVDEGSRETLARHAGPLPALLAAPRDVPLVLIAEAPGRTRHVARIRLTADRTLRVPFPEGGAIGGIVSDEDGAPVAEATLRIEREGDPSYPWAARTDAEGRFHVDTLVPGRFHVEAVAPGFARALRDGVEPGADLRLTLARVTRVNGRVVDPDGRGAAGVTVVIAGSGLWPARQTETDDDGRFELEAIPPGVYEVRAFRDELAAPPRRGLSVEAGQPAFLTFALAEGAILRGVIRDAVGSRPIANAQVTVSTEALDAAPRATTTDAEGRFRVGGLGSAAVRVSVFAEGYVPVSALEWSPARPLELTLEPAASLVGVVLDEDRQPLEGATIEVLGETDEGQPVALDAATSFRSAVFAAQLAPLEVTPGGPLPVVEGPVPPIPIAPAVDFDAPHFDAPPPAPAELHASASYVTDAEGRFRIGGVPPGRVQIIARAAGRAPASTSRIFVTSGRERDDIELVLPPAGRLRGFVRDGRSEGVEGVLVEVRADREPYPRVTFTDERGAFELDDVFGELVVTATPRGRPAARAEVSVGSGEEAEIALALEGELHAVHGRVVDAGGFPIARAQLVLSSLRADAPFRRTFFAHPDGTFELNGLPAPPWRLSADDGEHAPAELDVLSEDALRVVLASAARVSGSVVDDLSGEAVAATVTLSRDGLPPERRQTRADGQGTFSFARVHAGRWTIEVEREGYLALRETLEVVDRGRGPRDVELGALRLTPAGRLEGTVVDALGAPVAHARVWLEGDASVHTHTDRNGEFVLPGVPPGEACAIAEHPAAGEGRSATVRVLLGRETRGVLVHLASRFDPERANALPGRRTGVALSLEWSGDRARVREVVGRRALEAGLRPGDTIETVDGAPLASLRAAARALRGPLGVPAFLGVRRGEERAVVVVPRERWLPR